MGEPDQVPHQPTQEEIERLEALPEASDEPAAPAAEVEPEPADVPANPVIRPRDTVETAKSVFRD